MNLFKSLFLGSAATLVAVAGVQAADLPMAEPVEYVKVCDTYGNGFFYLPGTETCLRVGGAVRVEALYVAPRTDEQTKVAFRARARAILDARTATEYGLLRSYVRLQFDRNTTGSTGQPFDYALIQFAGLTVGYTDSFFDFKPYSSYAGMLTSDIQTLLFAYTAEFGDGFSGTIAAEDRTYREANTLSSTDMITPAGTVPRGSPFDYAGQSMPDFVANLRVEQGWGSAQISAAVHQIDPSNKLGVGDVDAEYGWAVQGGVQVNLPMIAEDDFVYVSGAYAEGALSYLISGAGVGQGGTNNYAFNGLPISDYLFTGRPNASVAMTKGFNVNGGFSHNWSPNWRSAVDVSYADIDYAHNVRGFNPDWALVTVAAQTVWTPVRNLSIGGEVTYTKVTDRPDGYRRGWDGTPGGASPDNWAGRIRVERTF